MAFPSGEGGCPKSRRMRSLPYGLPLWGRWLPEGQTDEVPLCISHKSLRKDLITRSAGASPCAGKPVQYSPKQALTAPAMYSEPTAQTAPSSPAAAEAASTPAGMSAQTVTGLP